MDIRSRFCRSPFPRGAGGCSNIKSFAELAFPDGADISFVSSGMSSGFSSGRMSIDRMYPPRLSNGSDSHDRSFESTWTPHRSSDAYSIENDYSYQSSTGTSTSWSSQNMDDVEAEMKRLKLELKQTMDMYSAACREARKYTIKEIEQATNNFADTRKIGEGGYGPVYKCYLDHTPVAIKVQVLSCIRHPNMVLLLGACPEYGCLVYEYMANGSLDDRLFRRGNTPVIPWQHRFRISAEIATALLFLHQTKPEPLVHRDLKPGNILLDHNYVSKISDVGLARLVPPSVANTVTQYRMTSTAGTFCYIDPEYQQTGMLGVKSDVYSLGVMLLQIITAKPPMGLTHHVSRAIEKGTFAEMLDPAVTDWPLEEAQRYAELALQCAELRRKDRPDLATIVLPELNKLRGLGEDNMDYCILCCDTLCRIA